MGNILLWAIDNAWHTEWLHMYFWMTKWMSAIFKIMNVNIVLYQNVLNFMYGDW